MPRARIDALLVARGFFESRAKAHEALKAGLVRVDGAVVAKPSLLIDADSRIEADRLYPWVSRGGVKLAAALDAYAIDPEGAACLDLGASTGGFTNVLLSRGARHVFAVDVGAGQLHSSLRQDPRVTSLEKQDARDLTAALIDPPPDLIVADLSFISLTKALPRALALARPQARLVALIKPQFEGGPGAAVKGIVRDPQVRRAACEKISAFLGDSGWAVLGVMESPVLGGGGNREYLIAARRSRGSGATSPDD